MAFADIFSVSPLCCPPLSQAHTSPSPSSSACARLWRRVSSVSRNVVTIGRLAMLTPSRGSARLHQPDHPSYTPATSSLLRPKQYRAALRSRHCARLRDSRRSDSAAPCALPATPLQAYSAWNLVGTRWNDTSHAMANMDRRRAGRSWRCDCRRRVSLRRESTKEGVHELWLMTVVLHLHP
jgi:hypothetical protein